MRNAAMGSLGGAAIGGLIGGSRGAVGGALIGGVLGLATTPEYQQGYVPNRPSNESYGYYR